MKIKFYFTNRTCNCCCENTKSIKKIRYFEVSEPEKQNHYQNSLQITYTFVKPKFKTITINALT